MEESGKSNNARQKEKEDKEETEKLI